MNFNNISKTNKKKIFFLQPNKDPPRLVQNPQPPPSSASTYVAAYDFQPQEEGEIELKRGDRIRMLDQSDVNWWKGEVRGNIGLFPATYVRPV